MNNNREQQEAYERLRADPYMDRKYDAYRHPHIKYYEQCRAQRLAARAKVVHPDLVAGIDRDLAYLEVMRERGYFASAEKCGGKDYWIDAKAIAIDRAQAHFNAAESWRHMLGDDKYAEHHMAIAEEVRKLENFGIAQLRKAGIVRDRKWIPTQREISTLREIIKGFDQ